jgi:hypothetical protein
MPKSSSWIAGELAPRSVLHLAPGVASLASCWSVGEEKDYKNTLENHTKRHAMKGHFGLAGMCRLCYTITGMDLARR